MTRVATTEIPQRIAHETGTTSPAEPALTFASMRIAQTRWASITLRKRLAVIKRFRHLLAEHGADLVAALAHLPRAERESWVSEVIPLADACRFLEREAETLLRTERLGRRGRPLWVGRTFTEIQREPIGLILVVGPGNYPLLLPGVQAVQALAAGNAVVLKPGHGGLRVATLFAELFEQAGLDAPLLRVLGEDKESVARAIEAGVDQVVMTGSRESGRAVMELLAPRGIPCIMELSGNDAAVILPSADDATAVRAIRFGMLLNHGRTCIAPRRLIVPADRAAEVERLLIEELRGAKAWPVDPATWAQVQRSVADAVDQGARVVTAPTSPHEFLPVVLAEVSSQMAIARSDCFAPIISIMPVPAGTDMAEVVNASPLKLGASLFGDEQEAAALARRLNVGLVVINDMIAPTADPRVPFGGRGASGFGTTRGADGLRGMTRIKTVIRRRGRFLPHIEKPTADDAVLFDAYLRAAHGGSWTARMKQMVQVIKALAARGKSGHRKTQRSGMNGD